MHIDKLWAGAQKTRSLNVPYDLQKYFTLSGSGMLETSRFLKQMLAISKDTDLYKETTPTEADHVDLGDNKEGQDSPEGDATSNVALPDSESLDQNQSHGGVPLS